MTRGVATVVSKVYWALGRVTIRSWRSSTSALLGPTVLLTGTVYATWRVCVDDAHVFVLLLEFVVSSHAPMEESRVPFWRHSSQKKPDSSLAEKSRFSRVAASTENSALTYSRE